MKYHYDKIFILAILLIVIVFSFLYKTYSINLQKEKEKEVINTQLLKEKEIIKEREKIDEKIKQENQIEINNQKEHLDACLQDIIEYQKKAYDQVIIPYYNKCEDMYNRNPISGGGCFKALNDARAELKDDAEKSEENCYKKYPQK